MNALRSMYKSAAGVTKDMTTQATQSIQNMGLGSTPRQPATPFDANGHFHKQYLLDLLDTKLLKTNE